jgi:hypothetical protein
LRQVRLGVHRDPRRTGRASLLRTAYDPQEIVNRQQHGHCDSFQCRAAGVGAVDLKSFRGRRFELEWLTRWARGIAAKPARPKSCAPSRDRALSPAAARIWQNSNPDRCHPRTSQQIRSIRCHTGHKATGGTGCWHPPIEEHSLQPASSASGSFLSKTRDSIDCPVQQISAGYVCATTLSSMLK